MAVMAGAGREAVKAQRSRFRRIMGAPDRVDGVEMTSASLDCYRALRDAVAEATFFQIYGNLDASILPMNAATKRPRSQ